uniref:Odorant receptor n=2 Tax=Cydia pomonella TaxID=82600 RepID=H9A5Q2_CYDPO|nr:putative odorant receptor OR58 [Cydia pomonella]
MMPIKPFQNNRTSDLFHTICKIIYLSCATNFWFEDIDYPAIFMKIYNSTSRVLEVTVAVLIISDWGAFWTQPNLTEKQSNDRMLFAFSHVVLYSVYCSVIYYKREIRELVMTLTVRLKEVCYDGSIEKMMLRTTFRYTTAFVFVCSSTLFSFGIGSGFQALTTNATFTTIIPIWPDVEDRRLVAGAARIILYIVWWIFLVRFISVYIILLISTIGIAHQFKNLCKYFEDLTDIFEGSGSQEEKERRYENAFKVGIKMHSITLWCMRQIQLVGGVAFSGQVIINVSVLGLLMIQMMFTERTLIAVMPIIFMVSSVLVGTGVFLWNAGDVTIEASRLPAAMFHSGWHNCTRQSSVRVRKLVTIAIAQAQKRVRIKGLGFIELSYESYVTIVKSSYSLFSVIY